MLIHESLPQDPRFVAAGASLGPNGGALALAVYLNASLYAKRHNLHSRIGDEALPVACGGVRDPDRVARAMARPDVGLWRRVKSGYFIPSYRPWWRSTGDVAFHRAERHRVQHLVRTAGLRARLADQWGDRCLYCGAIGDEGFLQIEHMVPLARGGTSAFENLTLACLGCNMRKGTRTADEFINSTNK